MEMPPSEYPAYLLEGSRHGRPIMLKNIVRTILLGTAIAVIGDSAIAAGVGRVATIDIPGNTLEIFDIGYVDANASRYYIADRSNAAVDIFDTQKNIFVGRVA